MSGLWWIGLFQFVILGGLCGFAFAAPKVHHFPSADRPILLGIAAFLGLFALLGLVIMSWR